MPSCAEGIFIYIYLQHTIKVIKKTLIAEGFNFERICYSLMNFF